MTDGRGGTATARVGVTVRQSATPQSGPDVAALSAESGACVVLHSTGSAFSTQTFGGWNPAAGWRDALTWDFDGDGKMDIAGRTADGHWWVGISNGTAFNTTHWGAFPVGGPYVDVRGGYFAA